MQPDTIYAKHYAALTDYDKGTIDGSLERKDLGSWMESVLVERGRVCGCNLSNPIRSSGIRGVTFILIR